MFEISMKNKTGTHYIKMKSGFLKKRFFIARIMDPSIEVDDETTAVDMGDKFQRELGKYGY